MNRTIESMVGKTFSSVIVDNSKEEMLFVADNGKQWRFYHIQDCCESVTIEDVCGSLDDLTGSPLLQAEESSNEESENDGSCTWTFYKFATVKGSVTVRWYGSSNGYYSESVSVYESGGTDV